MGLACRAFLICIVFGLFGCIHKKGNDNEPTTPITPPLPSPPSTVSVVEADNEFRKLLYNLGHQTDFVVAKPFQAHTVGTFLQGDKEIGGPSGRIGLELETHDFDDLSFSYTTSLEEENDSRNVALGIVPGIAAIQNKARQKKSGRYVDYNIGLINVRRSKLTAKNLRDYIKLEHAGNLSSNKLVYGVYYADVVVNFNVIDQKSTTMQQDGALISEILGSASDIDRTETTNTNYNSAIKSRQPVVIALLLRDLSAANSAPQIVGVERVENKLQVTWEKASSDIERYRVYWSSYTPALVPASAEEIAAGNKSVFDLPPEATSYNIPLDINQRRYYIAVTAVTIGQEGNPSDLQIHDVYQGDPVVTVGPGLPKPNVSNPIEKTSTKTRVALQGCNRDSTSIDCYFDLYNEGIEEWISIQNSTEIYDNSSESYRSKDIQLGKGGPRLKALTGFRIPMKITFSPVLPNIDFLPVLRVSFTNGREFGTVEFSNIQFFAKR